MTPRPHPAIAVSAASFARHSTLVQELEQLGFPVKLNATGRVLGTADLVAFIGDASVAIVGTEHIDATVLDACPGLRFIAKYGVGLDNLDLPLLSSRNIGLGWTGGINRRSVSELVLAFALGHFHRVNAAVSEMRQGLWVKNGGVQLSNLTVGIVGLGHVGSDLAGLLKHLAPHIVYCDIADKSAEAKFLGIQPVSYDELIRSCDLITFHVPATAATKGMFNTKTIAMAKNNALIINTSRGGVVDVDATCQAVVEHKLGGYAADVFPEEPADMRRWAACDRLYFTPHIGGNTAEAVLAMGRAAIDHVQVYLRHSVAAL